MGRATVVLGLTSSIVALIALAYGISSHRSPSTVEPDLGESNQAQQTSSVDAELSESTSVVPPQSLDDYQNPAVTEAVLDTAVRVDEETSRKMTRDNATRNILRWYSLLLEELDLAQTEKEALVSFLIEAQIAATWTYYVQGKPMSEDERSNGIAAIIGDAKLQQFLALKHNLRVYGEVQAVQSTLQLNDIPMTDTRRDELIEIMIETRSRYFGTTRPADVERDSIEFLEYQMNQVDEYQRLVLELAASVLSPQQLQYLFDRYQARSYQWQHVVEIQRKARADPTSEYMPLYYPGD